MYQLLTNQADQVTALLMLLMLTCVLPVGVIAVGDGMRRKVHRERMWMRHYVTGFAALIGFRGEPSVPAHRLSLCRGRHSA